MSAGPTRNTCTGTSIATHGAPSPSKPSPPSSPKCASTGLGACAAAAEEGTPQRRNPENTHDANAPRARERREAGAEAAASSSSASSSASSSTPAPASSSVSPCTNPSAPGPSVVPAAKEYPRAGAAVVPDLVSNPRPRGSHACALATGPRMGIAPSSRNAFSAAAAWAAPVATHPATSSAPAIPSPMHVVVAPLRPSHGRRAPSISSSPVDFAFESTRHAPRTFGETSPDAPWGNATTAPCPRPARPARVNPPAAIAAAARAGAEDAGNVAKPASKTASPSFAPNDVSSALAPARPSPRSAVSANHDATPLLSPLTDRFVRRSDVPCTANHAIAHTTFPESSSSSSSSSSGFPNAARTVKVSSTFPSCASRSSDGFLAYAAGERLTATPGTRRLASVIRVVSSRVAASSCAAMSASTTPSSCARNVSRTPPPSVRLYSGCGAYPPGAAWVCVAHTHTFVSSNGDASTDTRSSWTSASNDPARFSASYGDDSRDASATARAASMAETSRRAAALRSGKTMQASTTTTATVASGRSRAPVPGGAEERTNARAH